MPQAKVIIDSTVTSSPYQWVKTADPLTYTSDVEEAEGFSPLVVDEEVEKLNEVSPGRYYSGNPTTPPPPPPGI